MKWALFILILSFTSACVLFKGNFDNDDLAEQYPAIASFVKSDNTAQYDMVYYLNLLHQDWKIKSEEDIKAVLKYRDSMVIPGIDILLINYEENNLDSIIKLYEELKSIGILLIGAEGIFGNAAPTDILQEKILKYATAEFQLYNKIKNKYSETLGGEYPFIDMSADIENLSMTERFLREYSQSSYRQEIEVIHYRHLKDLVDVHRQIDEDGSSFYLVEGTSMGYWPYATPLEIRAEYIKGFPKSKYNGILQKIIENISEIEAGKEELFVIVAGQRETYPEAFDNFKVYMERVLDIPHILPVNSLSGSKYYANVYRFYSDLEKAKAALKKIQESIPEATLIKVSEPSSIDLDEIEF